MSKAPMSEAPKICKHCPLRMEEDAFDCLCSSDFPITADAHPDESCPFVRLDAANAEMTKVLLREKELEAALINAQAEIERINTEHYTAATEINEIALADRQRHRDELAAKDAEIERLRDFVDEIADSPCTAPSSGYAAGHGEVSCYPGCAACRARVFNVEYPRQALGGSDENLDIHA